MEVTDDQLKERLKELLKSVDLDNTTGNKFYLVPRLRKLERAVGPFHCFHVQLQTMM